MLYLYLDCTLVVYSPVVCLDQERWKRRKYTSYVNDWVSMNSFYTALEFLSQVHFTLYYVYHYKIYYVTIA